MELRIAAILGVIAAGLQLFIHLIYILLSFAGSAGNSHIYTVMQVVGLLPAVGFLACFIFFLIGFNKLLAPASGQSSS